MKGINFSSTQSFLDILDIKDNVLILKGGRFCMILESSALNFDLLAEKEQDAAIYAYANFVNSLKNPIQIVIKTRRVNIDKYLDFLKENEKLQTSEALREQIRSYINFIRQLVMENTILNKRFYVVVPYQTVPLAAPNFIDVLSGFLPFLKKPVSSGPKYDLKAFEKAKQIFSEQEQEFAWHFRRMGLEIKRLNNADLVRLFFEIFNPQAETHQLLSQDIEGYLTPFVKAAVI